MPAQGLRFSVGPPPSLEVCPGSSPIGPAPTIRIDECTSLAGGTLVVEATGLQSGQLLAGLARGRFAISPNGASTCIRPFAGLGVLPSPSSTRFVVDPALYSSLPVMAGETLLLQAWSVTPSLAGILTNALALEIAP